MSCSLIVVSRQVVVLELVGVVHLLACVQAKEKADHKASDESGD